MSNKHLTAAFKCREFTGVTRLLLLYLADKCSSGKHTDGKHFPFGYTGRSVRAMMNGINTNRSQTVTDTLKELREAGAIKTIHRKQKTALTFVNLEYLEANAYTPEDNAKRTALNPHLLAKASDRLAP